MPFGRGWLVCTLALGRGGRVEGEITRSLDRFELDESNYTAVQCDGCGYWTTVYWTVDAGEGGVMEFCASCDKRAASDEPAAYDEKLARQRRDRNSGRARMRQAVALSRLGRPHTG